MIALSIALNDLLYITLDISLLFPSSSSPTLIGLGLARGSVELADRHLFSLYLMLPLIGVCLGLLKHNWFVSFLPLLFNRSPTNRRYPARAFIGDTFCYFSGMAFAVVGILGHFSKTLLLFFLPQIFNFLYSLPQLSGIIPCPRHRLPRYNERTGLLEPSFAPLPRPPTGVVKMGLEGLAAVGLLRIVRGSKGEVVGCSNFTILNLILVVRGPMKEDRLTLWLLGVQVMGSAVAFGVRYGGAGLFYEASRR